ncbi:hypothetical protein BAUCODRAFT_222983 [Baudoinia panamericana UAMH 10762]|uniref:Velvet domain-containing protein n=1 Tax=Baudoinia panamericana (strain UAMH 10762) TaxID=717646 RepID=M2LIY8_BAUPA|nr:uncharacterized protein BAUCODRAFT_222983 [Baudoinia panamericana UAMH 10762]EMC94177.1 hypothetical protein BAUCODRAFT_222983 [Baudoinia panamericana UAMH 10762]
MSPRSYLREGNGPRVVDTGIGHEEGRRDSKAALRGDERSDHRSKSDSSRRLTKKDTAHRRKQSASQVPTGRLEQPFFELDVIGQPPQSVVLGMPVDTTVLVTLRFPNADRHISAASIDTSAFFAATSLITDNRSGERVPLESGILSGQKLFDSIHPIPEACPDRFANDQPCSLVLGYFSFTSLLIRQPGTYRIRISLIEMSQTGRGGATNIVTIDSDNIRVERRSTAMTRRQQRACN